MNDDIKKFFMISLAVAGIVIVLLIVGKILGSLSWWVFATFFLLEAIAIAAGVLVLLNQTEKTRTMGYAAPFQQAGSGQAPPTLQPSVAFQPTAVPQAPQAPPIVQQPPVSAAVIPENTIKCINCGFELPPDSVFCLECGTRLQSKCANCGVELPQNSKFCLNCGTPVPASP